MDHQLAVPGPTSELLAVLRRSWASAVATAVPSGAQLEHHLGSRLDDLAAAGRLDEPSLLAVTQEVAEAALEMTSAEVARDLSRRLRRAVYEYLLAVDAAADLAVLAPEVAAPVAAPEATTRRREVVIIGLEEAEALARQAIETGKVVPVQGGAPMPPEGRGADDVVTAATVQTMVEDADFCETGLRDEPLSSSTSDAEAEQPESSSTDVGIAEPSGRFCSAIPDEPSATRLGDVAASEPVAHSGETTPTAGASSGNIALDVAETWLEGRAERLSDLVDGEPRPATTDDVVEEGAAAEAARFVPMGAGEPKTEAAEELPDLAALLQRLRPRRRPAPGLAGSGGRVPRPAASAPPSRPADEGRADGRGTPGVDLRAPWPVPGDSPTAPPTRPEVAGSLPATPSPADETPPPTSTWVFGPETARTRSPGPDGPKDSWASPIAGFEAVSSGAAGGAEQSGPPSPPAAAAPTPLGVRRWPEIPVPPLLASSAVPGLGTDAEAGRPHGEDASGASAGGAAAPSRGWSIRQSPRQQLLAERMAAKRREEAVRIALEAAQLAAALTEPQGGRRRRRGEPTRLPDVDGLRQLVEEQLRRRKGADVASLLQRAAQEQGGREIADLALDAGDRCLALGQSRSATNCYLAAWRADPIYEAPLWKLADVCLAEREVELATGYLERIAGLMRSRGDDQGALSVYRKIVTIAPERSDVRDVLRLYQTTGRLD